MSRFMSRSELPPDGPVGSSEIGMDGPSGSETMLIDVSYHAEFSLDSFKASWVLKIIQPEIVGPWGSRY